MTTSARRAARPNAPGASSTTTTQTRRKARTSVSSSTGATNSWGSSVYDALGKIGRFVMLTAAARAAVDGCLPSPVWALDLGNEPIKTGGQADDFYALGLGSTLNRLPIQVPTSSQVVLDKFKVRGSDDGKPLRAIFGNAPLTDERFASAKLSGARFNKGNLINIDFRDADLSHASFKGNRIIAGNFLAADLRGTSFVYATILAGQFTRADLRGVSFQYTTIRGSTFVKTDLRGASFKGCTILGLDFTDADLSKASFRGTYSDEREYAVKFNGANLDGTDFRGSGMDRQAVLDLGGNPLESTIFDDV